MFQWIPTSYLVQNAACYVGISSVCFIHFFNLTPCWAHKPPYLDIWSNLILTRQQNDSHWGIVATEIAAKLPPFSPNHFPDTISPVWHLKKILSNEAKWVNVSHWGPGHQTWGSELNSSSLKSGDLLEGYSLRGADINPGLLNIKLLPPVGNGNDSVQCDHFYEMTQIMLYLFGAFLKI